MPRKCDCRVTYELVLDQESGYWVVSGMKVKHWVEGVGNEMPEGVGGTIVQKTLSLMGQKHAGNAFGKALVSKVFSEIDRMKRGGTDGGQ